MVELKFRDIGSLNSVTDALTKNGYSYSTFVIWDKHGRIDCFSVRIEGMENGGNKTS